MRSATIGHFTGQVVHGLGGGGVMAGSAGAVEGVGVGQVVQGLWRGRGWHCWPAARTLQRRKLQQQHAQLVCGAHQFQKVTKQVLHRDDKQLKYCGN